MPPNMYEVPPMSPAEKQFVLDARPDPEVVDLYERIRTKILLYGKIEVWVTKNYLNFKHPYIKWNPATHRREPAMGTLILVTIREKSITLAFNTLGNLPHDHKNLLKPTNSFGVCSYYANFKPSDSLEGLDEIIQQTIRYVSHTPRAVRINGKYIML